MNDLSKKSIPQLLELADKQIKHTRRNVGQAWRTIELAKLRLPTQKK